MNTHHGPGLLLVALVLALCAPAFAAGDVTLRALIVSCTDYVTPRYNQIQASCLSDRKLVLDALEFVRKQGWGRVVVHDLTGRAATGEALRRALRAMIEEAGPEDTALVYFTGHGILDAAGTGAYLLCSDESYVGRVEVADELRRARCRLKLLITDCCSTYFRMPEARLENAGDSGVPQPIARSLLFGHRGFTDVTAASAGQAAYATELGGYFTSWLVGLATTGENLTWQEVFDRTRTHVRNEVRERHELVQEPQALSLAVPLERSPAPASRYAVVGVSPGSHLFIRQGPDRGYPAIARIPAGTRGVSGTGREEPGWIEVRHAGRQGWCAREHLSPEDGAADIYRVRQVPAGQHLNVRREPVRPPGDDNIIEQIPHDGRGLVRVEGPRDGWIKIRYPSGGTDLTGWVSLDFVEPDGP